MTFSLKIALGGLFFLALLFLGFSVHTQREKTQIEEELIGTRRQLQNAAEQRKNAIEKRAAAERERLNAERQRQDAVEQRAVAERERLNAE